MILVRTLVDFRLPFGDFLDFFLPLVIVNSIRYQQRDIRIGKNLTGDAALKPLTKSNSASSRRTSAAIASAVMKPSLATRSRSASIP
ncbi:hypothetical protein [Bradyrhizobium sp. LMTR 3]|uniref:hypothetical protein n=1 Tax=Bradyrhizobium sp. LMTR 3 TaxID=189873 RepID=UPI0008103C20|nr:hypothetical protein [Bradyrhizobium sp. LMTR 3]OCK55009.1 hypothetical protein LMTR3_09545 [Bradyrhizobium sp. LMTR 3]